MILIFPESMLNTTILTPLCDEKHHPSATPVFLQDPCCPSRVFDIISTGFMFVGLIRRVHL